MQIIFVIFFNYSGLNMILFLTIDSIFFLQFMNDLNTIKQGCYRYTTCALTWM